MLMQSFFWNLMNNVKKATVLFGVYGGSDEGADCPLGAGAAPEARSPPAAWVFSLPLWAYRVLMLGWALWLALAVVRYARWAWTCFSTDRLWGPWRLRTAPAG